MPKTETKLEFYPEPMAERVAVKLHDPSRKKTFTFSNIQVPKDKKFVEIPDVRTPFVSCLCSFAEDKRFEYLERLVDLPCEAILAEGRRYADPMARLERLVDLPCEAVLAEGRRHANPMVRQVDWLLLKYLMDDTVIRLVNSPEPNTAKRVKEYHTKLIEKVPRFFTVLEQSAIEDPDAGVRYRALSVLQYAIEYISPKNSTLLGTDSEEYEKRLPQFFKTLVQVIAKDKDPTVRGGACRYLLKTLEDISSLQDRDVNLNSDECYDILKGQLVTEEDSEICALLEQIVIAILDYRRTQAVDRLLKNQLLIENYRHKRWKPQDVDRSVLLSALQYTSPIKRLLGGRQRHPWIIVVEKVDTWTAFEDAYKKFRGFCSNVQAADFRHFESLDKVLVDYYSYHYHLSFAYQEMYRLIGMHRYECLAEKWHTGPELRKPIEFAGLLARKLQLLLENVIVPTEKKTLDAYQQALEFFRDKNSLIKQACEHIQKCSSGDTKQQAASSAKKGELQRWASAPTISDSSSPWPDRRAASYRTLP